VLQVNKFYGPRGGTERVLFDLEDGLRQRGHEVGIFAGFHARNRPSVGPSWFVPERNYDSPSFAERVGHAMGTLYDRGARNHLAQALDEFEPDVVHLHNIYHQLSPSILDELYDRRLPAVMTVHDYKLACPVYRLYRDGELCEECVGRDWPAGVLVHRCSRGSLMESALLAVESSWHRRRASYPRALDTFISPSTFLAEKLAEAGLPEDRIEVVRNAPRSTPRLAGPLPDPPTVLCAGRLSPEKGVELLVEAAIQVPEVEIRIAGTGPEEDRLRSVAPPNVAFMGRVEAPRLDQERARSRASVVPSRWYENAPMSVIESWWAGRAVLGSGHGGLAEMLGDGEAGWTVEPTVVAWVRALRRVAGAGVELERLGRQARARAEREHGFDAYLDRILEIYDRAIHD
jgi:glycosyltransferase involved in cell wall biosynthesis